MRFLNFLYLFTLFGSANGLQNAKGPILFNCTVISMHKHRYNHTSALLREIGFRVRRKSPYHIVAASAKLQEAFQSLSIYSTMTYESLSDEHRKVFSNYLTFRELISSFGEDNTLPLSSWRFFFEDDVSLVPGSSTASAAVNIQNGIQIADEKGFEHIWLGVCAPKCKGIFNKSFAECYGGNCAHAFGVRRSLAVTLPDALLLQQETRLKPNADRFYYDVAMRLYTTHVRSSLVIGYGAVSPQSKEHMGLFFQDRRKFGSSISNIAGTSVA